MNHEWTRIHTNRIRTARPPAAGGHFLERAEAVRDLLRPSPSSRPSRDIFRRGLAKVRKDFECRGVRRWTRSKAGRGGSGARPGTAGLNSIPSSPSVPLRDLLRPSPSSRPSRDIFRKGLAKVRKDFEGREVTRRTRSKAGSGGSDARPGTAGLNSIPSSPSVPLRDILRPSSSSRPSRDIFRKGLAKVRKDFEGREVTRRTRSKAGRGEPEARVRPARGLQGGCGSGMD